MSSGDLYAMYLRKSRADLEKERLGEYETLAVHQRDLEELARRCGYALDQPYYRELVCGEHIADRPEFQRLMQAFMSGKYRGILVHEVSRLGRGTAMEYGWILFQLQLSRTLIVTPTKIYDPNDQDDARHLEMEMFVSNMEFGSIKNRLVNACQKSAENGHFVKPIPPYGYDRIKDESKGWTLMPNDDASTVRMIFERAAAGVPLGTIAKDMNDAGMRTPSGTYWSAGRLATIISNPHYKGVIRYGYYKREIVPGTDLSSLKRKHVRNENCQEKPGLHEPIVSEDLWQRANDRNHGSAPVKRDYALKNPLAGIIVCSKCGHAMTRFVNRVPSSGNEIEHLRHQPFKGCKAQGARLSVVMELVCDALEDAAAELEIQPEEVPDTTHDELASVRKKLAVEKRRLDKLLELYMADALTIDEFRTRKVASEQCAEQLKAREAELSVEKRTPRQLAATIKDAVRMLQDDAIPAAEKNAALKAFIERIEYENHTPPRSRRYDIRLKVLFKP